MIIFNNNDKRDGEKSSYRNKERARQTMSMACSMNAEIVPFENDGKLK